MIFTGVTGGEIVSMLYPLFILSPFCYIIISKESLDGAAYEYGWDGDVQFAKKDQSASHSGAADIRGMYDCLRLDLRHG